MKKYIKKIIIIVIIFSALLFLNVFVNQLNNDEIWNYGFSYNIYKGLIPYQDFNMVITPLYPFLISIFFHIFGGNILVLHIINVLLLLGIIYLIYKLIGDKIYILGIIVLLFSNCLTFPNYNLFILFLLILIIFIEKKESNDYLIGFLIACTVLTKQSIGLFLLLPSVYYFKDKKKLIKRFIGFIIPCLLFFIYLLIQGNLKEFLDLCLFGLFDFGKENSSGLGLGIIALIIYIGIVIYLIVIDKKNINNYYALAFTSMMIPLMDAHHCLMAYILLFIVISMKYNYSIKINMCLVLCICYIFISAINIYRYNEGFKIIYPNNINHFEYRFIRSDLIKQTHSIEKYIKKNKDIVLLTSDAYYYRLVTDTKITYLDLINNGNYGYKGSNKIIRDIKKRKNAIFLINEEEYKSGNQIDKASIKYVIENAKKKGNIQIYSIYEFE